MEDLVLMIFLPDRASCSKGLFSKPKHCLDSNLNTGSGITTEDGKQYVVLDYVDTGRSGVVYKVEDDSGTLFALKVAVSTVRKVIRSIRNDKLKSDVLSKYQVVHAKVVHIGGNYVIKEWVAGIRFDHWREAWEAEGFPENPCELVDFIDDLHTYAKKGLYINDLSQKNIIWDGHRWVIVDTSKIRKSLSEAEALQLYRVKLKHKLTVNASDAFKNKFATYWHW